MARLRLTETNRIEAFSDGVFAIALTLLVLDLHVPDTHRFLRDLAADGVGYAAYLAAFLTIASIWANHHDTFTRVARSDPRLLVLNLLLLLGVSLVPWPTSLVAAAMRGGDRRDEIIAIAIYGAVSLLVSAAFLALDDLLSRSPHLLRDPGDVEAVRRNRRGKIAAVVPIVIAAGIAFAAPVVSLAIFLVVPLLFFASLWRSRDPADADDTSGAADTSGTDDTSGAADRADHPDPA